MWFFNKWNIIISIFNIKDTLSSDGFYMERAERSLQAPLQKFRKAAPPKKCREASTTKKMPQSSSP